MTVLCQAPFTLYFPGKEDQNLGQHRKEELTDRRAMKL
jgi:hypothetical protein